MGMVLNIPEVAVDYMLYGDTSRQVSNYIGQQLQNLPQAFNAVTSKVHSALTASYNYLNDSLAKYNVMNILQRNNISVADNYIQPLYTEEQLRSANMTMQRWIMSEPTLKKLYVDQNVDGYSESYKDVFGGGVADQDYNYRRVYHGVQQDFDDHSVVKHYMEDLMPGDRHLTFQEKADIITTHDHIRHLIKHFDVDFTSSSNEARINRE